MSNENEEKDTMVAFSFIKRIVHLKVYRFNKTADSTGLIAFDYVSKDDTFSVLCDTLSRQWRGRFNRSATWREAKVVCPDKSSSNYLPFTTLLHRMQTDDKFFPNKIPDVKKFHTPKVE